MALFWLTSFSLTNIMNWEITSWSLSKKMARRNLEYFNVLNWAKMIHLHFKSFRIDQTQLMETVKYKCFDRTRNLSKINFDFTDAHIHWPKTPKLCLFPFVNICRWLNVLSKQNRFCQKYFLVSVPARLQPKKKHSHTKGRHLYKYRYSLGRASPFISYWSRWLFWGQVKLKNLDEAMACHHGYALKFT